MKPMTRYILTVFVASLIMAGACTGRKNKAEHKNIIPEKDLISILSDVYLADGLLSLSSINYKFSQGDTLSSYIDIIKGYGYTKSQMDRTMRYYFIKKPRKLIKIYDRVLGGLSETESKVDKEYSKVMGEGQNLWPGKSFYSFPDPAGEDSTWIDFPLNYAPAYHLKFTLTIYPDDQSVNPHLDLFFSHSDTAGNEKRIKISTLPYIKDGKPHAYNILSIHKLPPPISLKGWFINLEETAPYREKHFRIENIILSR
jgi:hypothetical protein